MSVAAAGRSLTFRKFRAPFGRHDVSGVGAHVGGAAAGACKDIGAVAYATGNDVAFGSSPTLHTAAHEAAHVVQQRAGVSLKGGVGQVGDRYEQHADQVADLVVQGKSAESMLDQMAGGGARGVAPSQGGVQREAACTESRPQDAHDVIAMANCLHGKFQNIQGVASGLRSAADDIREAGTHWYGDDQSLIAVARSLTSAAENIASAGSELQSFTGRMKDVDLGAISGTIRKLKTALDAADLFARFMDEASLEAFLADPTPDNANRWANHVTGLFTSAADLFPDSIKGFPLAGMIKGYLQAPAAYVNAFQSVLTEYTMKIDSVTDGTDSGQYVKGGVGQDTWTGELSGLYFTAPPALRQFMSAHSDKDGVDLEEATIAGGIAHLLHLIDQYATDDDDDEGWIDYIRTHQ